MKRILTFLFLFSLVFNCYAQDAYTKTAAIFDAMEKEMERTMSMSKTEPKIHFAAFRVGDNTGLSVVAARGGIVQERQSEWAETNVSLRVGNQKEDSSYFEAAILSQGNLQEGAISPEGVRAGLWAESDKSYKNALDIYARKQGYKSKKAQEEVYDDFSKITPKQDVKGYEKTVFPMELFKDIAQKTSAAGALKELEKFNTQVTANEEIIYYLSSEGSKYTKRDMFIKITFFAKARTANGFEFDDSKTLTYAALEDVPQVKELENIAASFAKQTAAFTKAEKGTPFIGPVWLEGEASAKMFEKTFIENILNTRKIIVSGFDGSFSYILSNFALKTGLKVLSVNFDVIDDPLQDRFNGKKMLGAYKIDDEGAKAETIYLVKNGILKDLPKTRSLIKGQTKTNGHAFVNWGYGLYGKSMVRNLFLLPHTTIPASEFKQKFMEYCKAEGLEYCYKITSPKISDANDILAIKINSSTGEETPVYGFKKPELSTRTLRDIKFAADDLTLYNVGISYVVPSVILSEAELTPTQKSPSTKIIVSRPNI